MKKHFLKRGETYEKNWLSMLGSKEESDNIIMEVIKFLADIRSERKIVSKLVAQISFYDPSKYDDLITPKYIKNDIDIGILIGFLEGSAVNQNFVAHPITESQFGSFKFKLMGLIKNAFSLEITDIYNLTYEDINNIFKEFKIDYYIILSKENGYIIWKGCDKND